MSAVQAEDQRVRGTLQNLAVHVGDGSKRRESASRFVDQVTKAVRGRAPWTPTPFPDQALLADWLPEFPDCAMCEVGLADLSIIKEFDRQCALHRMRRVFIWSYDTHLQGYDCIVELRAGRK